MAVETIILPVYAPPGRLAGFWRSFRENRGAVLGLAVVSLIVLVAIFANVLAPHNSATVQNRRAFYLYMIGAAQK